MNWFYTLWITGCKRNQLLGSVADGAAGVGHVVHEDGHAVLDVAHQHHAVHLVGLLPLLVDQSEVHVQPVGDGRHAGERERGGGTVSTGERDTTFRPDWNAVSESHRFAPPASGDTMIQFFHSGMFSLIHCRTAGSAYRLSTAMSKKPFKKINRF